MSQQLIYNLSKIYNLTRSDQNVSTNNFIIIIIYNFYFLCTQGIEVQAGVCCHKKHCFLLTIQRSQVNNLMEDINIYFK